MSDKKRGMAKGDPTASEAGRKGGEATHAARGREHYQAIGKRGAATLHERYGAEHFARVGRKGGLARHGKELPPEEASPPPAAAALTWWDVYSAIEWLALDSGQPVDIANICLLIKRGPLGIAGHLDALRDAGLIDYAERGIVLVPPKEGDSTPI